MRFRRIDADQSHPLSIGQQERVAIDDPFDREISGMRGNSETEAEEEGEGPCHGVILAMYSRWR